MPILYRPHAQVNGTSARDVHITASLAHPWRSAQFGGESQYQEVTVTLATDDLESTVFQGQVDDPGAHAWETGQGKARGLPDWRKKLRPQGFQDVRLETLLQWIADQCGGKVQINTKGEIQRSYQLVVGSAYQRVQEALQAWRDSSVLVELDGGVLYVGPEEDCPQSGLYPLKLEYGQNIRKLEQSGRDRWKITVQLLPDLRLLNRLDIEHPLITGRVKVIHLVHHASDRTGTEMEVMRI